MPVQFDVPNKQGNVIYFDPLDLVIKPELNGRRDVVDLTELKASIKEFGQIEPVLIRKEENKPVLVMGFSRWQAIVELNHEDPEAKIKISALYTQCSEQHGFLLNYEENRRRNATTPLDDGYHYAQLRKWNWEIKDIAEKCKVSVSHVNQMLDLNAAEPEVKQAVKEKRLKPTAAVKIARLSSAKQRSIAAKPGAIKEKDIPEIASKRVTIIDVKEHIEIAMAKEGQTTSVRAFGTELLNLIEGKKK